jgi:hypothetical protein
MFTRTVTRIIDSLSSENRGESTKRRGHHMNPYTGIVRAPEFPPDVAWVNARPLHMADLRGKYVILDFWTAG